MQQTRADIQNNLGLEQRVFSCINEAKVHNKTKERLVGKDSTHRVAISNKVS